MTTQTSTIDIRRYTDRHLELNLRVQAEGDVADAMQAAATGLLAALRGCRLDGGIRTSLAMRGVDGTPQCFESTHRYEIAFHGPEDLERLLGRLLGAEGIADRVEVSDVSGREAEWTLLEAARYGSEARARALLAVAGEHPEQAEALTLAAARGHAGTVGAILDAGAGDADGGRAEALRLACEADHTGVAAMLLERGADARAADSLGLSALHYAARAGARRAVRLLLSRGAEAAARASHMVECVTPLHCAAMSGDATVLGDLLDHGADVDETDRLRYTALHHAAQGGHIEAVRALIDAGAAPNLRGSEGSTPLLMAWAQGHTEVARLLAEAGGVE